METSPILNLNFTTNGTFAALFKNISLEESTFKKALYNVKHAESWPNFQHPKLEPLLQTLLEEGDLSRESANTFLDYFFGEGWRYDAKNLGTTCLFYAKRQAQIEEAIQYLLECEDNLTRRGYDLLEAAIEKFCLGNLAPRHRRNFLKEIGNTMGEDINPKLAAENLEPVTLETLRFWGQIDFILQQGPQEAILARFQGCNDHRDEYCPISDSHKFPRRFPGTPYATAFFGPIHRHLNFDPPLASKTIDIKKFKEAQIRQSFNDNPPSEIKTHFWLSKRHNQCPLPSHSRPSDMIAEFLGITRDPNLGSKGSIIYWMGAGSNFFTEVSEGYDQKLTEWRRHLRTKPNPADTIYFEKSPWEKARCDDFFRLAEGLMYMHKMGIAHRDFKLENTVRGVKDGQVRIIDFGVAHRFGLWERGRRMRCWDKVGTPCYMSPECYHVGKKNIQKMWIKKHEKRGGHRYWDAAANDMWSLGITLFLMIFAMPAYSSCTNADHKFQYLTGGAYLDPTTRSKLSRKVSLKSLVKSSKRHIMATKAVMDLLPRFFKQEDERITMEQLFQHDWMKSSTLYPEFKRRWSRMAPNPVPVPVNLPRPTAERHLSEESVASADKPEATRPKDSKQDAKPQTKSAKAVADQEVTKNIVGPEDTESIAVIVEAFSRI